MIYIRVEQERKKIWSFKVFEAVLIRTHVDMLNNHVQMITYQNHRVEQWQSQCNCDEYSRSAYRWISASETQV